MQDYIEQNNRTKPKNEYIKWLGTDQCANFNVLHQTQCSSYSYFNSAVRQNKKTVHWKINQCFMSFEDPEFNVEIQPAPKLKEGCYSAEWCEAVVWQVKAKTRRTASLSNVFRYRFRCSLFSRPLGNTEFNRDSLRKSWRFCQHFLINIIVLEFHGRKEFHLAVAYCGQVLQQGRNSDKKTQRVSIRLVWCLPSVRRTQQSNLCPNVHVNKCFGQYNRSSLLERSHIYMALACKCSTCKITYKYCKSVYTLLELAILATATWPQLLSRMLH